MVALEDTGSTPEASSHGDAVRASSIIGGASVLNIAIGLIRMKVAAVVLGPVGVGVIGLLQNLLNAASTLGSLNLGIAGSRQIVSDESEAGPAAAARTRKAVFITSLILAAVSSVIFLILARPLTRLVFGDPRQTANVALLVFGLAAIIAAGRQTAVLTASKRIGDLARVTVFSAAAAALIGSLSVLLWHSGGIAAFVLASPLATLAFGWIYVRRLKLKTSPERPTRADFSGLLRLGAAITTSIFVSLCGQLFIRTRIHAELGATALGQFQAAWTIAVVYLAFIFQAMGSDYLPRLTAAMTEPGRARKLVADQAEVGLLLAAPVLTAMIGLAPWVLALLYTTEFRPAATLLRWQVMGDLLRLASWPVSFTLLAGGAGRDYTIADVLGTAVLVIGTLLLIPTAGLAAAGIAYAAMNLFYLALVTNLVGKRYAVTMDARVHRIFAALGATCALTFAAGELSLLAGAVIGPAAAIVWSAFGFDRLRRAGALPFAG
jgi:PST family polysaccharide transporter